MPRLNGTGPRGQGPRTGRGLGNCQGAGQGVGRGFGRGLGQGRGRFFRFAGKALTKEEQKKSLEKEKKAIEQEIADLNA